MNGHSTVRSSHQTVIRLIKSSSGEGIELQVQPLKPQVLSNIFVSLGTITVLLYYTEYSYMHLLFGNNEKIRINHFEINPSIQVHRISNSLRGPGNKNGGLKT